MWHQPRWLRQWLYLSDAFEARRIGLVEWFYNAVGSDLDFLHKGCPPEDLQLRQRAWNAPALIEMAALDAVVAPTEWQRSQFPAWMQPRIQVIHEGIDVQCLSALKRQPRQQRFGVPNDPACEILTYVSRGFESAAVSRRPCGRSLLQRSRPNFTVLVVRHGCLWLWRPDGLSWQTWAVGNWV